MTLTDSLEDYLEAIYQLVVRDEEVRTTQLAEMLNVKKSSVTVALRNLAKKKLIHYTPYSTITLTDQGKQAAQDILRRHETLTDFLVKVLAIDPEMAETTACKMEHALPLEVTDKLNRFMDFLTLCPRSGQDWLDQFQKYCVTNSDDKSCRDCITQLNHTVAQQFQPKNEKPLINSLSVLQPGQQAEIVKITHHGSFRRRILEMGVTKGAVIKVERVAPLGDPIDIKIRGYHLSLRKEEAKNIEVKLLN